MIENRGVVLILRPYNRFPSKFQNFERQCRNSSLFLVKCGYIAVALKFLKTCLGTYRSLFLIGKSNAARKFSIEDGVYVARSQKSFKVREKFSVSRYLADRSVLGAPPPSPPIRTWLVSRCLGISVSSGRETLGGPPSPPPPFRIPKIIKQLWEAFVVKISVVAVALAWY